MTLLAVIDNTADHPAQTAIGQGVRAWTRIKATAEEQRTLWLEVGVALLFGRIKGNREPGQKFSEWVQEKFPGLPADTAAHAMWFATNSGTLPEITSDLTHPKLIRQWANEQATTPALPEDLHTVAPEPTLRLPQRDAERVAKVAQRAASQDEGSATAKRHLESLAKRHATTPEKLVEAAKAGAPDTYFRFPPAQLEQLDALRASLRVSITEMTEDGIPLDAIKSIFIHLAHNL